MACRLSNSSDLALQTVKLKRSWAAECQTQAIFACRLSNPSDLELRTVKLKRPRAADCQTQEILGCRLPNSRDLHPCHICVHPWHVRTMLSFSYCPTAITAPRMHLLTRPTTLGTTLIVTAAARARARGRQGAHARGRARAHTHLGNMFNMSGGKHSMAHSFVLAPADHIAGSESRYWTCLHTCYICMHPWHVRTVQPWHTRTI